MTEAPAPDEIGALALKIVQNASKKSVLIATAESCTGGLIGAALTDVPGSSAAFDRGFITYSNDAKINMLGVPTDIIERHGAVSMETAEKMALGAILNSSADIAVSVTGIAGPGGGTLEKPVGLVHFGLALKSGVALTEKHNFPSTDTRDEIRARATKRALELLIANL